jgi:hypothetical protein
MGTNLPMPLMSSVGRERELAVLIEAERLAPAPL